MSIKTQQGDNKIETILPSEGLLTCNEVDFCPGKDEKIGDKYDRCIEALNNSITACNEYKQELAKLREMAEKTLDRVEIDLLDEKIDKIFDSRRGADMFR